MITDIEQKMIDNIIDNFDFDKVHKVMKFLDWRWVMIGVPSVANLKYRANGLLIQACKDKQYIIATGGFIVNRIVHDDESFNLELIFAVDHWDKHSSDYTRKPFEN